MYCELAVSEAERMMLKAKKLGAHHENYKFLVVEINTDLRKAERELHSLDPDEQSIMKDKIAAIRKEIGGK